MMMGVALVVVVAALLQHDACMYITFENAIHLFRLKWNELNVYLQFS
jgi:hypothetical protein